VFRRLKRRGRELLAEEPERKSAALEIPGSEWCEPFGDRRAIKLDNLIAVHRPGREILREYPTRRTNPVKILIGGLLRGGHEFDPSNAVIPDDGRRPLGRPFAIEKQNFGKTTIPRIGQFDVAAIDPRRSDNEFRKPGSAELARLVGCGVEDDGRDEPKVSLNVRPNHSGRRERSRALGLLTGLGKRPRSECHGRARLTPPTNLPLLRRYRP
jgi:hypothetical protein